MPGRPRPAHQDFPSGALDDINRQLDAINAWIRSNGVQHGEATVTFTAAENSSEATVIFAQEFAAVPFVALTANFAALGFFVPGVVSLTTAQVVMRGTQPGHTPTGSAKILWAAWA